MIRMGRPDSRFLAALVHRLTDAQLTYPQPGQTRAGDLPAGYNHDRLAVAVGLGDADWARAQEGLRHWEAHRGAGMHLFPEEPALAEGTIVVAVLAVGPTSLVSPCRIVYTTEETDRFGFAYGTLPGHSEQGEEAFHVVRDAGGEVRFEIVAFSRPAELVVRLGAPVARLFQSHVTRRYLAAMERFVAGGR